MSTQIFKDEHDFAYSINPKMSSIIKGLAIILMVFHHSLGFPDWYVTADYYGNFQLLGHDFSFWFNDSFKICVSLFAFTTGYSYFFAKDKSYKYSFRKILGVLLNYWFILFVIFIPLSMILANYQPSLGRIVLLMFALKDNLVVFAWYIAFYLFVMMILPLISRIQTGNFLIDFAIPTALCLGIIRILPYIKIPREYIIINISEWLYWFPCVLIGYLFAYYNIFKWMYKYFYIQNIAKSIAIIVIIILSRLFVDSIFGLTMDIIYAPIFVFECVNIFNENRLPWLNKLLCFLGHYSLNIWLLHAIFFNNYTIALRPIAYLPHFPLLVGLWIIILCLPFAIVIDYICKKVHNIIINKSLGTNAS